MLKRCALIFWILSVVKGIAFPESTNSPGTESTLWRTEDLYEVLSDLLDKSDGAEQDSTTYLDSTNDRPTTVIDSSTEYEPQQNNMRNKKIEYEFISPTASSSNQRSSTVPDEPRKTHVKWKTISVNGKAQYTLLKFYQSHGHSYEITIPGGLPAPQNHVIEWIRSYGNQYSKREIPYVEENGQPPKKVLPDSCGTKFESKLFGGRATPIEQNPWQVAILRRKGKTHLCGGAVITRRHSLSAAHCFRKEDVAAESVVLHVGDFDKEVAEEYEKDYRVEKLIIHLEYNHSSHLNDIAIVITRENIIFSPRVYPVCLPGYAQSYIPGLKCTISGWGQVESKHIPMRYLRSGEVSIMSRDICEQKTSFTNGVPLEIFCVEDPLKKGVDTCLGDSGGPLTCWDNGSYFLFGITSFGSYPCGQDIPSFYTTVAYYRHWILQQITGT